MEKKYQVFVSSTYQDLIDERNEVMKALLELDCIPTGMELFPSADDDQMTYIRKIIDNCDYYILILAGRYGTLHSSGKSYTQLEYEYAIQKEIPVIAFLHNNPQNILASKTDKILKSQKKLNNFRNLAEKKLCRYWNNASELSALVSRSLVKLIKEKPQKGWVKASQTFEPTKIDNLEKIVSEISKIKEFLQIANVDTKFSESNYIRMEQELKSEKIELEIIGINHSDNSYKIILEEAVDRRKIFCVIGSFEAQAIVIGLDKEIKTPRPLTHDLIISIVQNTNIEIVETIIDYFFDGVFYSKLILKIGTMLIQIDSRTSDAIALAVRLGIPIYSYQNTFEEAFKNNSWDNFSATNTDHGDL